MPVTQAKGGYKTFFEMFNSGAYARIAEVKDISGPDITKQTEEVTNMDSDDGYAEHISVGIRDGGTVSFQVNLIEVNTSHALMRAALEQDVPRQFQIIYPSGTRALRFTGHVASFTANHPVKSPMTRDISIKITGRPVEVTLP
jgi:predicted secreted protein